MADLSQQQADTLIANSQLDAQALAAANLPQHLLNPQFVKGQLYPDLAGFRPSGVAPHPVAAAAPEVQAAIGKTPPVASGVAPNRLATPPDVVASTQGMDAAIAGVTTAAAKTQALADQQAKATAPLRAEALRSLQEERKTLAATKEQIEQTGLAAEKALQPWDVDKETAKYTTPPMQQFGSAGVAFAMLASAFTHTPMINALNGAAGAMKAIQAGDAEQYKRAYEAWQANTDLVLKRSEMMMNKYRAILDIAEKDPVAAQAQLAMVTAQYGDQITAQANVAGAFEKVGTIINQRIQSTIQMRDARMKQMSLDVLDMKLDEFYRENGRQPTGDEFGKMWQEAQQMMDASSMPPDVIHDIAERFIAGDKTAVTSGVLGFGNSGKANRTAVQVEISRIMKAENLKPQDILIKEAEFQGLISGERASGTRLANIEQAVSELNRVIPLALDASSKVPREQFVAWNQVVQAVQTGTSSPEMNQFYAATQTLMNVYARAINPSGVATVYSQEEARKMISTATDQKGYAATVAQMKKEAEASHAAPYDVRNTLAKMTKDRAPGAKGNPFVLEKPEDYNAIDGDTYYTVPGDNRIFHKPKDQ